MSQTVDPFTEGERRALGAALRAGEALLCPRCATRLDQRPVPPRTDVSYVRDRAWVSCPSCHRSAVLDRKQPE
ncbi:MAG: hypothetical protein R3253_13985 [Longimicrobiales bacterium]|nr:hypothetical protein [Longimicrobiales bacterium]